MLRHYNRSEENRRKQARIAEEQIAELERELERKIDFEDGVQRVEIRQMGGYLAFLKKVDPARYMVYRYGYNRGFPFYLVNRRKIILN